MDSGKALLSETAVTFTDLSGRSRKRNPRVQALFSELPNEAKTEELVAASLSRRRSSSLRLPSERGFQDLTGAKWGAKTEAFVLEGD